MKIKTLPIIALLFVIFSCSKNEDAAPVTPPATVVDPADLVVTTFMPIAVTNRWTYDTATTIVTPAPTTAQPTTGLDALFVGSEVTENNVLYKLMDTNPATPTGFYSTMLKGNKLRIDGSSLKLTGNINYNVGTNVLSLAISNFTLFKENATAGSIVGDTGTITSRQTVQSIPVDVTYKITSKAQGSVASITYNGITYNDVKKNVLTVNLAAIATVGTAPTTVQLPLLASQDAIVSTQYYSKNNGMIKAETVVKYQLETTASSFFTTVPPNGEQNIIENLKLKSF